MRQAEPLLSAVFPSAACPSGVGSLPLTVPLQLAKEDERMQRRDACMPAAACKHFKFYRDRQLPSYHSNSNAER